MEADLPLENIDAMALRRVRGRGVDVRQVEGLRTLLSVWSATTPVDDPRAADEQAIEEAARRREVEDARADVWRWSTEQMDAVRDRILPLAPRRKLAYDVDDVNRFLEGVIDAMRRGVELPDTTYVRFGSSGMRRGYDPKPVDDLLLDIAAMKPQG